MELSRVQKLNSNQQELAKIQTLDVKNTWWNLKQFNYLLHWVSIPHKMQKLAKEVLKKIAAEYLVIFEVWIIRDLRQDPYVLISVRAIQPESKLCQFLNHMRNLYTVILVFFPFKIQQVWVFNRYGYHQIGSVDLECIICLDKRTVAPNVCCGKAVCKNCSDNSKPCPYCRQPLLKVRQLVQEEKEYYQRGLNEDVKEFLLKVGFLKQV